MGIAADECRFSAKFLVEVSVTFSTYAPTSTAKLFPVDVNLDNGLRSIVTSTAGAMHATARAHPPLCQLILLVVIAAIFEAILTALSSITSWLEAFTLNKVSVI